jgi:hypothetical protein
MQTVLRIALIAIAFMAGVMAAPKAGLAQGQPLIKMGACPQGYYPVCAVIKRTLVTYVNACAAKGVGARVVTHHACMEGCPRKYAPVCAIDASGPRRTFGNACEAEKSGAKVVRNRGCRGLLGRR